MLQSTSGRRVKAVIPSTAYEMPSCPATGQRHPNSHIGFGQFNMDELGGKTHEHNLKHTDIVPMPPPTIMVRFLCNLSTDVSMFLFLNHVRERVVTPKYVDAPCILSLGNLLDSAPSGWFCWYIFTGELFMLSYVHVYGMFTFIRHFVNACVLLIWFACRSGIKVGWVPWCRCRKDIPVPLH